MIRIVVLGGTGDAYLVCALYEAFKRHHGRDDVELVIKASHAAVADMFGARYSVDEAMILRVEADHDLHRDYENILPADHQPFYAHPCFLRSSVRVDKLTTKPDASQADMYKMILRLPPETELALPRIPEATPVDNTVLMITQATSWPNNQPEFWDLLADGLRSIGRTVIINDLSWSLAELFHHCAASEWVIGPQCGVMSILVTGRFPCRKTLATPDIDGNDTHFLARDTYPYGYVTKFANCDYDVEEFKIGSGNHVELVADLIQGQNALRLWHHNPTPVTTINVPLAPGDFLDRLAVLTVKRNHLPVAKRAALEREYQRHQELYRQSNFTPEVQSAFADLLTLHEQNFAALEILVPAALNGGADIVAQHIDAMRSNRDRIFFKNRIDALCHAPYTEVKSYHAD